MRQVFADTQYFVALLNEQDQGHRSAVAASRSLASVQLVTTEEVLIELLAFFAERGPRLRRLATDLIDDISDDPETTVLAQSHRSFRDGLALFKARPDKGYSLTDAISMTTMTRLQITAILTHDHHFAQEGFQLLL